MSGREGALLADLRRGEPGADAGEGYSPSPGGERVGVQALREQVPDEALLLDARLEATEGVA